MEILLTDEQRLLHDSAGTFFARLGGAKRTRALRDSETGFDREALRKMADNGWLGLLAAETAGGAALGPTELALILQQAGRALAPEPISQVMLAALMMADSDDDGVREELLPSVLAGQALIVPAIEEFSGSLDPDATQMRAERRGGEWRLNGRKSFVLGAGASDGFLVSAWDAEGPAICHVPRTAPGLDIRLVPTVEGRSYGELTFRDVPSVHVVARGNSAAATLQRCTSLALLAASAEMLGVMEAVSELTVEYLKTRKQFGRAIGSFQALQHRAVDNYVLIESTRSLLHQICEGGEPLPASMVCALKAVASSAALTVTKSAVQLHGAIGFTDEHDAGLYLKRAMWLSSYLGNASAQQQRYGRLA